MKASARTALLLCLALILGSCGSQGPTTPDPPAPTEPVISTFSASPGDIILESSSELSWGVTNATKATIDQGIGDVPLSGSTTVRPSDTTTYTLTATNGSLQAVKTCTVTVDWKGFVVFVTDAGEKYHRDGCQYLNKSKVQKTLGAACREGYGPCSVCKPPACRSNGIDPSGSGGNDRK